MILNPSIPDRLTLPTIMPVMLAGILVYTDSFQFPLALDGDFTFAKRSLHREIGRLLCHFSPRAEGIRGHAVIPADCRANEAELRTTWRKS